MTATSEGPAQLDRAIDELLRDGRRMRDVDESESTATARLVRDALPRFHPRFSFEEALTARLAAARRALVSGPTPVPEPTRIRTAMAEAAAEDPVAAAERRRRGLVAGGAIASGVSLAIPIAGAAIVVWRRSRSSGGIL